MQACDPVTGREVADGERGNFVVSASRRCPLPALRPAGHRHGVARALRVRRDRPPRGHAARARRRRRARRPAAPCSRSTCNSCSRRSAPPSSSWWPTRIARRTLRMRVECDGDVAPITAAVAAGLAVVGRRRGHPGGQPAALELRSPAASPARRRRSRGWAATSRAPSRPRWCRRARSSPGPRWIPVATWSRGRSTRRSSPASSWRGCRRRRRRPRQRAQPRPSPTRPRRRGFISLRRFHIALRFPVIGRSGGAKLCVNARFCLWKSSSGGGAVRRWSSWWWSACRRRWARRRAPG